MESHTWNAIEGKKGKIAETSSGRRCHNSPAWRVRPLLDQAGVNSGLSTTKPLQRNC
jgi:hypothetical protein